MADRQPDRDGRFLVDVLVAIALAIVAVFELGGVLRVFAFVHDWPASQPWGWQRQPTTFPVVQGSQAPLAADGVQLWAIGSPESRRPRRPLTGTRASAGDRRSCHSPPR